MPAQEGTADVSLLGVFVIPPYATLRVVNMTLEAFTRSLDALVYALWRSDLPRNTPGFSAQYAVVREQARQLVPDPAGRPLMIACARQVIGDDEVEVPITALRGTDREIAEALLDAGFSVRVRTYLAALEVAPPEHICC